MVIAKIAPKNSRIGRTQALQPACQIHLAQIRPSRCDEAVAGRKKLPVRTR
ncbi:hypothetical protein [Roseibium suaedae]|uniref:hypothetical protein n=1 Tax=Roseibium suaedae TaxID=735517 RepID=UPI001588007D|nr:hypothetical protein [Roseibium suaedae]